MSTADERSEASQRNMSRSARILHSAMVGCVDDAKKDASIFLDKMSYKYGMSRAEAEAWLTQPAPSDIQKQLYERALRSGDTRLANRMLRDRDAFVFSRKKALSYAISARVSEYTQQFRQRLKPIYADTAYESYGRAWFDIQKGTRVGFTLSGFPQKMIESTVNSALSYTSSYLWLDRNLGRALKNELLKGVIMGLGVRDIAKNLEQTAKTTPWRAKAMARTALTEVANDTSLKTIKEAGLNRYEYQASLDERTCEVCGALDGKVFNVDDGKTGVNRPPMHKNCRCTTTAVITQESKEKSVRRARDDAGNWTLLRGDITYEEWKKEYLPKRENAP